MEYIKFYNYLLVGEALEHLAHYKMALVSYAKAIKYLNCNKVPKDLKLALCKCAAIVANTRSKSFPSRVNSSYYSKYCLSLCIRIDHMDIKTWARLLKVIS